jgi:predicted transcriptional regulator
MSTPNPGPPPPLHELEAEVMEDIWRLGEVNVRTVMDALNARSEKERKYTTIMTIMSRLDTKGLLNRRRQGKTDFYSPSMSREEYLEARAQAEVGALVDEFGDVALVHFAKQMATLDPKRREQLRRLARRG